ncbi:hypothetical protein Halar_3354 [halophilic archaeon DL31]|nr:hypothetical protein Halar_3354 [halophilic archaeon DL31]
MTSTVTRPSGDDRLEAIRNATDLSEFAELYRVESRHEAYFRAKRDWEVAVAERQREAPSPTELPGTTTVDGHDFHIHGVTHAGTPEERSFRDAPLHGSNPLANSSTPRYRSGYSHGPWRI